MPNLILNHANKTNHYHVYTSSNGSALEIIMQPRDAMIFPVIKKLPELNREIEADLIAMSELILKKYGGKTITTIASEVFSGLSATRAAEIQAMIDKVFTPGPGNLKVIPKSDMKAAYDQMSKKPHVARHLEKFKNGQLRTLTSEEIKKRIDDIAEFKILHASFVDDVKIKRGQYSRRAEKDKIDNPKSTHVVIVDEKNNIVALGMSVFYGNSAYGADFIVHPDYRTKEKTPGGLGQVLGLKMYEDMIHVNPALNDITFIGGGHGDFVGPRLFGEHGFKCQSIDIKDNFSAQQKAGIYVDFRGPAELLLEAGHRNPNILDSKVISSRDPVEEIEEALKLWQNRSEQNLAAKQPAPQQPSVVSGGMFGSTEKEEVLSSTTQSKTQFAFNKTEQS